jgi:alkanesulfonate monooxygenase SsuD/methylene tetrahydromethanopterin reductase-like flavin-dependent oxidoreductase (luciferase family)
MEFGIFDHLDRNDLALHDYYEARLKIVEAYERAGFYCYHLAEHHFTPLGLAPSPSVFLAAAAQRTTRLRLGTMVYALPLHHPLRVVEEICMLDHLSNGRLDIGFGRGSVPYEVAYYGENAGERQAIYAERVELVLKAFTENPLSFSGKYDRFTDVPMEIAPLQTPHPPVWYGAHSPDSAERAARKGFHIINNDIPEVAVPTLARFRAVWRATHGDAGPTPKAGLVRHIVVADSDAAALSAARRAYPRWYRNFHHLFRLNNAMPDLPRPPNFDVMIERGQGIAGKPQTVINWLVPQLRETGANYLVGHMCYGDMPLDVALRSIELFGREVMPALRAAAN